MKYIVLDESLVINIALALPHAIFPTSLSPYAIYSIQTGSSA